MDYKISFEYKGIGKQASQARQKAIQAQKSAEKKAGTQAGGSQSLSINREFINSINKLIDSNKRLEAAVRRSAGIGGGGGKPGGGGGGESGSGAAIGRAGASLVGVGVLTGIAGFAIQKVQQVANAYIELTGRQSRSVGMGGFQSGRGMYLSADMGAGMAEYAKRSGEFAHGVNVDSKEVSRAIGIGGAYGLSAEEALGAAGSFSRAKADYGKAAAYGRGSGIESEMPAFLQALSGELEDAFTRGIDASEMAKTFDKNLADITAMTPSKSVQAAMGMIKSTQASQQRSAKGQVGGYEDYFTREGSKNIMSDFLKDPNSVKKLVQQGIITEEEAGKIAGKDMAGIERTLGAGAAATLRRVIIGQADTSEVALSKYGAVGEEYGYTPEGKRQAFLTAQDQGWSGSNEEFFTMYQLAEKKYKLGKNVSAEDIKKSQAGEKLISEDISRVNESPVAIGIQREQGREDMILAYGESFARTSMEMEEQMLSLARTTLPAVTKALGMLEIAVNAVSGGKIKKFFLEKLADPAHLKAAEDAAAGKGDYLKIIFEESSTIGG